jgi:hypothetical protein
MRARLGGPGRSFLVLSLALLLSCSGGAPSRVPGAPTTPPDVEYETDGGFAYRVLVWTCDARHERVVMYQSCGEGCTGCGGWAFDRTLCPGGVTAFEASISGKGHHPIPAGYGWR